MIINTTSISAKDFASLRIRSGMSSKTIDGSRIALNNSLYTVGIYEDDNLIAFGRVVGDGSISFVINDIMVDKDHQRKGLGSIIMQYITNYLDENITKDSYICLIADKPANYLYEKFGFKYLNDITNCAMYKRL